MTPQPDLDLLIAEHVLPYAATVDGDGAHPKEAIEALREAGYLGATVPTEFGGAGIGLAGGVDVVRRLGAACSSTAMIVTMHYAATAVLAAVGREDVLREIAAGTHLSTLAFSEAGSRSHFWAPLGTATAGRDGILLDARKSWVTAAGEADSYVWSSLPVTADEGMSLWFVRTSSPGLAVGGDFDGVGLRGNGSRPVVAAGTPVSRGDLLGADGAGLETALESALPWFLACSAAAGVGLMRAVQAETLDHLGRTRFEHLGRSLAQEPMQRSRFARMQIRLDGTNALLDAALRAVEEGRPEAQLLVLETKAMADEATLEVTDLAMTACGGAAFRKEVGIERRMRDARAARVMAPTTDALHDFVGRAVAGFPLLGD